NEYCPDGGIGVRDRLKIYCPKGHAGSIPAPGTQDFGPMNRSSLSTDPRRDTEIVQALLCRHSISARSHASVKIRRMSSDWFENIWASRLRTVSRSFLG